MNSKPQSWRRRLTFLVPLACIDIAEALITLVTLGGVNTGWSLNYAFQRALIDSRKARSTAVGQEGQQ